MVESKSGVWYLESLEWIFLLVGMSQASGFRRGLTGLVGLSLSAYYAR